MSTVTGVTGPKMTAFDASRVALEDLFEAHNLGWNWLGVWSNMVIAPNPHLTDVRPTSQMPVSLCDEDSSADEADQEGTGTSLEAMFEFPLPQLEPLNQMD